MLPIVPPYLAFMAGAAARRGATSGDLRLLRAAAFFVLGLSTVFLLLGLAASALGRVFLATSARWPSPPGWSIVVFGLHFLGLLRIPLLVAGGAVRGGGGTGTALGAYVFGLAFAFGWTPCIGPVLGAILALAAQGGSAGRGLLLMGGLRGRARGAVPADGAVPRPGADADARMRRHMGAVERVTGALLVAVGLMMLTGAFSGLSYWLLETFPALATIG